MRKYQSQITALRDELLASIKTILKNNNLDEITISDSDDKTYVPWWDSKGHINEGEVILVRLQKEKLSFIIDAEGYFGELELHEDDDFAFENPIWLNTIRDSILESLMLVHERVCHHCGKPMDSGYCIRGGEEYFCSDHCLFEHYSPDEWDKMCADNTSGNYWTDWSD